MPYDIMVSKEDGTLRVAWDNRRVPKDNATFLVMALFWAFWAPMTLVATWLLVRGTDQPFRSGSRSRPPGLSTALQDSWPWVPGRTRSAQAWNSHLANCSLRRQCGRAG